MAFTRLEGDGSPAVLRPTEEQEALIEAVLNRRHRIIKAVAFAGAAKTTSSRMVAEAYGRHYAGQSVLYLAYNKAVQMEAKASFPANVKPMTTHGLAYRQYGVPYQHKLNNIRIWDVTSAIPQLQTPVARMGLETLSRWLASADSVINADHVPEDYTAKNAQLGPLAVNVARAIWSKACDIKSPLPMPHDGYLKLFALSRPRLPYSLILFDEAQDANPVTRQLVLDQSQYGTQILMVGDPHQQIYTFRGAENALQQVDADAEVALTTSFRFGRGIANVASLILHELKHEARTIKGLGKHAQTKFWIDNAAGQAVLARTNAGLFETAATYAEAGRSLHFVGGVKYEREDNYKLRMIEDAYYLSKDRPQMVRTPALQAVGNWARLTEMADAGGDRELAILQKVVESRGDAIPDLIRKIVAAHTDSPSETTITLTTAHRSKGLEWDNVRLEHDFGSLYKDNKPLPLDELGDEANLLYVATTRARRALRMNDALREVVEHSGHADADLNSIFAKNDESSCDTPGMAA